MMIEGRRRWLPLIAASAIGLAVLGVLLAYPRSNVSAQDVGIAPTSISMDVGVDGDVVLEASDIPSPGLGAWTVDVSYDSSVVFVLDCVLGTGGLNCNTDTLGNIRVNGLSVGGLQGTITLATITFLCISNGVSPLTVSLEVFIDTSLADIGPDIADGSVTCTGGDGETPPAALLGFLPFLFLGDPAYGCTLLANSLDLSCTAGGAGPDYDCTLTVDGENDNAVESVECVDLEGGLDFFCLREDDSSICFAVFLPDFFEVYGCTLVGIAMTCTPLASIGGAYFCVSLGDTDVSCMTGTGGFPDFDCSVAIEGTGGGSISCVVAVATPTPTPTPTPTASPNEPPECQEVEITTDEDVQGSTDPDCTDVDDDDASLTIEIVDQASDGTASVGSLLYDPDDDFDGSDSFTYRACDDDNACSEPATVDVTVDAVNDSPECEDVTITTDEGTQGSTDPVCTDVDDDDVSLTIQITSQPSNGTATVGSLLYDPADDFVGSDSFTYRACDDEIACSVPATVDVTVGAGAASTQIWGDVDCDGDVDSVDGLKGLRHTVFLSVPQSEPCPDIGSTIEVEGSSPHLWGDLDCDNDTDSVDALKVLRSVVGLSSPQVEPCPDIGAIVTISSSSESLVVSDSGAWPLTSAVAGIALLGLGGLWGAGRRRRE